MNTAQNPYFEVCPHCALRFETYDNVCNECENANLYQPDASTLKNKIKKDGIVVTLCPFCEEDASLVGDNYECTCGAKGQERSDDSTIIEWVKQLKEEGIKYDSDKPRIGEMIKDFAIPLLEVCKVWEFGTNKYTKSNWTKVENGEDRYTNAMIRHLLMEDTEGKDVEMQIEHYAAVAWNALARIKFLKESTEI